MGVFHPDLVGIQARVLQRLGSRHVMVVYGLEGLDEISIGGETMVGELKNGEVREYAVHPRQFGIAVSELEGDPGGRKRRVARHAACRLWRTGLARRATLSP